MRAIPKEGQPLIEPIRRLGAPLGEHVGVQPYAGWQRAFDLLLTAGTRHYWKCHNFSTLEGALFGAVIASVGNMPSPHCEIIVAAIGSATSRPAPEGGVCAPGRQFDINVHGRSEDPGQRQARHRFNARLRQRFCASRAAASM